LVDKQAFFWVQVEGEKKLATQNLVPGNQVYNEKLGKWIELFGMGIFRPEVTKPLGITKPVLAWGGGIERIAMLKFGLDDVREFYNNNLSWLRTASKCQ